MRITAILVLIVTLLINQNVNAQKRNAFVIPDEPYRKNLRSDLAIWYDSSSNTSLAQLRHTALQSKFGENAYPVPLIGKFSGVMWSRLVITNPSQKYEKVYLNIKNRILRSYHIHKGVIKFDSSGKYLPMNATSARFFRGFIFEIPPGSTDTIFIAQQGSYGLRYKPGSFHIEASAMDEITFARNLRRDGFLFGFYFGFVFIVILYTLVVFLTFREISFLWFILYLVGTSLLILANYDIGMIYLWPGSADKEASFYLNAISNILTPFGIVAFITSFFKPYKLIPVFHRVLYILPVTVIGIQFFNLFFHNYASLSFYTHFTILGLVVLYYVEAIVLAIKKVQYAVTLSIAFSCLVVGIIVTNLIYTNVIHSSLATAKYIHLSGILLSCIGMIFIIFRYLINQRREKERAQLEALDAMEENERNILGINTMLEQKVQERTRELSEAKQKSEDLLHNILPEEIAHELKETGKSKARLFQNVSVLFTDFVNFTGISEKMAPEELVTEIDYCFQHFDQLTDKYGAEKIKTIGDAYLAVCGLPVETNDHAYKMVQLAKDIVTFMDEYRKERESQGRQFFEIRLGVHSGPVVAGIVGIKKFQFDIWGDTVNTASRLESNGEVGKINISGITKELVKDQFSCVHRGKISAKGKGEIDMYFVEF